eukprot:TRINITY_DN4094_c1_g1_i1.p1 TRINITY_DN4094_c1_g1~~TRINITY_DN4094_c1_g1_i1.p1  ORF type:complete len:313 (+),score=136.76 TRINITY_DN4094_c1_g1_i1:30-941(+)
MSTKVTLIIGDSTKFSFVNNKIQQNKLETNTTLKTLNEIIEIENENETIQSIDNLIISTNFKKSILSKTLLKIFSILKSGANLYIYQLISTNQNTEQLISSLELCNEDDLKSNLLITGFTNLTTNQLEFNLINVEPFVNNANLSTENLEILQKNTKIIEINCIKPSWQIGVSTPLRFAKKAEQQKQTVTLSSWAVSAQKNQDEEELEDEDKLLEEDDLKKPLVVKSDCETGIQRKACKNCTCGLAEQENQTAKIDSTDDILPVKSACGSCHLGDAFRCSTCPQRGKPAYQPGQTVLLDLTDDL